jgi:hypothetical protein
MHAWLSPSSADQENGGCGENIGKDPVPSKNAPADSQQSMAMTGQPGSPLPALAAIARRGIGPQNADPGCNRNACSSAVDSRPSIVFRCG